MGQVQAGVDRAVHWCLTQASRLALASLLHMRFAAAHALLTWHSPPRLPRTGRPTRYVYAGAMQGGPGGEPRFVGVTKYDLTKVSGSLIVEKGCNRENQARAGRPWRLA